MSSFCGEDFSQNLINVGKAPPLMGIDHKLRAGWTKKEILWPLHDGETT